MKKQFIIWDWNGTLLDDVDYCVACMNIVLKKHAIKPINQSIYKSTFTFPVKDYYSSIGFDFNKIDFEIPAMQFITEYYSGVGRVQLHNNVKETLLYFKTIGKTQFCLSAMEHSNLLKQLDEKDLEVYFDKVSGIDDHYAHSKIDKGESLISSFGKNNKNDFVLIGDTIHDYEVANHLGIDCILIDHGHQNPDRLLAVTNNVISDLNELRDLIT